MFDVHRFMVRVRSCFVDGRYQGTFYGRSLILVFRSGEAHEDVVGSLVYLWVR